MSESEGYHNVTPIITSGPKYVPEVQTPSVTSLNPIRQRSVAIFLGQEQGVSLSPEYPLSSQKRVRFALAAPCAIGVAAVSGWELRIHPCRSLLPICVLQK